MLANLMERDTMKMLLIVLVLLRHACRRVARFCRVLRNIRHLIRHRGRGGDHERGVKWITQATTLPTPPSASASGDCPPAAASSVAGRRRPSGCGPFPAQNCYSLREKARHPSRTAFSILPALSLWRGGGSCCLQDASPPPIGSPSDQKNW
jgi:hypothetical protein